MLQSKLIGETFKEWPGEATLKSHGLLVKGGYIRQMAGGIYTLLPLARKVTSKIEKIIRDEMNSIGSQEILMPVVATKKIWDMAGRYDSIGKELLKFTDRNDTQMVLSMTHEEATVFSMMNEGKSYQKYPFAVYQIQTKFRDEARPRGGLIRVREFTMKDAYSFHVTKESLDKTYDEYFEAYHRIYKKVGIPEVISVFSDTGMMGGSGAHEYMLLCDAGEDKIVVCKNCNYSANMEVACTDNIEAATKEIEELVKVNTPDINTIEELGGFLNLSTDKLMKAVVYTRLDNKTPIVVFIRADREVNETKLRNLLKIDDEMLEPRKESINDNICYGFIGPKDFASLNATVVYDISLKNENSLVCGANIKDYHLKGLNISRDVGNVEYVDVSKVVCKDSCPKCHEKMINISNGIEVGNIFKLGTKYTKDMGMTYLDENGKSQIPIMGCYGIGVGRLMASVLEAKATEKAVNWPTTIAPFDVHICPIDYTKNENIKMISDELYSKLQEYNLDVLLDDREKSAGVKFADADLVGAPIRVVASPRNTQNNLFEVKVTGHDEAYMIDKTNIYEFIISTREELLKEVLN